VQQASIHHVDHRLLCIQPGPQASPPIHLTTSQLGKLLNFQEHAWVAAVDRLEKLLHPEQQESELENYLLHSELSSDSHPKEAAWETSRVVLWPWENHWAVFLVAWEGQREK
jgi:hypothetical protein